MEKTEEKPEKRTPYAFGFAVALVEEHNNYNLTIDDDDKAAVANIFRYYGYKVPSMR